MIGRIEETKYYCMNTHPCAAEEKSAGQTAGVEKAGMDGICSRVKALLMEGRYAECEEVITMAMGKEPHAPQPHNLMGVFLEYENQHEEAMRHFRAAFALDPGYMPARFNLEQYGRVFCSKPRAAFFETDCPVCWIKKESGFL